jgi:hypothetical protein
VQALLLWKCNKYYTLGVCVCTLRYTARNVHAPYCHLGQAVQNFSTLSKKARLSGGNKIKSVFRFSLQLLSVRFLNNKN